MERVLTAEAMAFIAQLERRFGPRREALLAERVRRQREIRSGMGLDFKPGTRPIREATWQVAPAPADLTDRRVEITGPAERKMMINALNSGASVFMADFEDAFTPTWSNVLTGQLNCMAAVRRTLCHQSPEGKSYALNEATATLLVRPRGLHLHEKHVQLDARPISASLFDFGLYFFHNAAELLQRGSGPYFYLPKLQSHLEARLWNDVFRFAQEALGIPCGSVRATVLIETIWAAFEMDEILFELKDHAAGLNAGRWDYIFSLIKTFHADPQRVLPDRAQITMTVPFMAAYCDLLVQTCHKRGAHAIGGMAAFIPNRKDPDVTAAAIAKVTEDKEREALLGFDGTWVAHPDLVPVARPVFDRTMGDRPHQKDKLRSEVHVGAADLLDLTIPGGQITEAGLRKNLSVGIRYLSSWLSGTGAAALDNLMEDAATAEISRAQVWQWLHHGAQLADGRVVTRDLVNQICRQEFERLEGSSARLAEAAELFVGLVASEEFADFLTIPAYALVA
ncbi:MAG: malate synthase A [Cyanobacteria bacterium REEB65]|nr:malate synthase A [Cyanobacteria bacterium REEB65]